MTDIKPIILAKKWNVMQYLPYFICSRWHLILIALASLMLIPFPLAAQLAPGEEINPSGRDYQLMVKRTKTDLYRKRGKSVGKLIIFFVARRSFNRTQKGTIFSGSCTATLVKSDMILTAAHCLRDKFGDVLRAKIQFGFLTPTNVGQVFKVDVTKPVALQYDENGDWALLKIFEEDGRPVNMRKKGFQPLFLSAKKYRKHDRLALAVIHHPGGNVQHLSVGSNCETRGLIGNFLQFNCQSVGGSSGAPILGHNNEVVAILKGQFGVENRGTAIVSMIAESEIIKRISFFKRPLPFIRDIQLHLNVLGYRTGGKDGKLGRRTKKAIKLFYKQFNHGRPDFNNLKNILNRVTNQVSRCNTEGCSTKNPRITRPTTSLKPPSLKTCISGRKLTKYLTNKTLFFRKNAGKNAGKNWLAYFGGYGEGEYRNSKGRLTPINWSVHNDGETLLLRFGKAENFSTRKICLTQAERKEDRKTVWFDPENNSFTSRILTSKTGSLLRKKRGLVHLTSNLFDKKASPSFSCADYKKRRLSGRFAIDDLICISPSLARAEKNLRRSIPENDRYG